MTGPAAAEQGVPTPSGGGGTLGRRRPRSHQASHRERAVEACWAALGRYLTARAS